jgi:hypothetical protein
MIWEVYLARDKFWIIADILSWIAQSGGMRIPDGEAKEREKTNAGHQRRATTRR